MRAQKSSKSTENSKSTPAKQALWKAHLNLEIPTNDSFNGLFNMHAPCEYRKVYASSLAAELLWAPAHRMQNHYGYREVKWAHSKSARLADRLYDGLSSIQLKNCPKYGP
jgi:hypothetical protein